MITKKLNNEENETKCKIEAKYPPNEIIGFEGGMSTASAQKEPALSIDPERAVFLANGGKSEHMLVNISDKRIAVKVGIIAFFRTENRAWKG